MYHADGSSISSKESRLSGKGAGDLYKDPLASLIPPVTATTNTTRGTATSVRATLSPPPAVSPPTKSSPPGSTSSSRSSSRLQHHALFSSLTGDSGSGGSGGGSIFDSGSSSTLPSAKRDLFGDNTSTSSPSRRTSTPPLTRTSSNTVASTTSSVPTPPLGSNSARVLATTLDSDVSPLGRVNGPSSKTDEDDFSIRSPLISEPLTRTNSQASTQSHESVKSVKSALSHEIVDDTRSVTSRTTGKSSAPGTGTATPTKETQAPLPPISTSSVRSMPAGKASASGSDRTPKHASAPVQDPILNPLSGAPSSSSSASPSENRTSNSNRPSVDFAQPQAVLSPPVRPSSSASSQSIDTFQSISRTASPVHISVSRSGFERESDNMSPAPSSARSKLINIVIPDDAAAAFADDFFSAGPHEPFMPSTALRSSSVLDSGSINSTRAQISAATNFSGIGYSNSQAKSLNGGGSNNTVITPVLGRPGVGSSTVGQLKTRSGFSLGEDAADSSNPWGNSLVDSLDQATLGEKRIDYTQADASVGANFLAEVAFTLPSSSTPSSSLRHSASSSGSTGFSSNSFSSYSSTSRPLPPLDEEIGGFDDMFSALRSKKNQSSLSGGSRSSATAAAAGTTDAFSTGLSTWNVADAVEVAAALDPDFLGARPLENPGTAKILAMMQMPKDNLEKDISAQEIFDNPWE